MDRYSAGRVKVRGHVERCDWEISSFLDPGQNDGFRFEYSFVSTDCLSLIFVGPEADWDTWMNG